MKICICVQRYGLEVNGGAEVYARQIAEKLHEIGKHEVHVATTCAIDYVTWKNEYAEGTEELNGVVVHRFKSVSERDQKSFNKLCDRVLTTETSIEEQEEWMIAQGPNCPSLVDYLEASHDEYDVFIFVTYLYYTTYFGMKKVMDKAIFIPTAHDELPIHLTMFKDLFKNVSGLYYNTYEEKVVVNKFFDVEGIPDNNGEGGVGIDIPMLSGKVADFRRRYGIGGDYILYCGRIDENKCCPELFKYWAEYKKRNPASRLSLVLMGKEIIKVPRREDIISLGFVSEEDKYLGYKGASIFVLPSKYESLSIVVLEAMKLGTPVIVNGLCPVTKAHVVNSNAGLYYENFCEFEGTIEYLLYNEDISSQMGKNGIKYVDEHYNWDKIVEGYNDLIGRVINK